MTARRSWFAGLVVGAWAGFCLVYVAILGAILLVGFGVAAWIRRSWPAIGGLLLGAGGTILAMLALAARSCTEGCTPPDLTAFFVAGCAMGLIGGLLTARAVARSHAA